MLWRRAGGKKNESNSESPTSTKVEAVGESEFEAEPAARFEGDAELPLAIVEERFQLRIAFQGSRHFAHRRTRGFVAGEIARLILALAGLGEPLPVLHEAVGATTRIDAQFGFELEGPDSAVEPVVSRLTGKIRVLLVCGFGVVRAIG